MTTPSTLVADRYRLVKMLGAGGMGIVWHAWDERLHRPVALKMLRTQPELTDPERELATDRAMREARITAGLHHPHAVTVFDVVEHEGQPCIVMQLIESTPLSILLREHGILDPAETARIGAQVGSALAAAHKMRIVHRDVKPGNILITEDGSAMISDFGISHALGDATITATGMIHGTPAYLAPEVARGLPTSFASDVFSLGSTLYAMLEGEPPFGSDKNAIALLHKVARGGYPPPKHAGQLAPLLRQMLSPQPKRRPTMASVAQSLSARAGDARTTSAPAAPLAPASPADGTETERYPDATTERLQDVAPEAPELASTEPDQAAAEPDEADPVSVSVPD
ncbi:MAG TPA: serine/threonine-protein kinase, partial [Microbacterium sp.]|nr:serine/threonine-protein kinase [Microbacterium sp.]